MVCLEKLEIPTLDSMLNPLGRLVAISFFCEWTDSCCLLVAPTEATAGKLASLG